MCVSWFVLNMIRYLSAISLVSMSVLLSGFSPRKRRPTRTFSSRTTSGTCTSPTAAGSTPPKMPSYSALPAQQLLLALGFSCSHSCLCFSATWIQLRMEADFGSDSYYLEVREGRDNDWATAGGCSHGYRTHHSQQLTLAWIWDVPGLSLIFIWSDFDICLIFIWFRYLPDLYLI